MRRAAFFTLGCKVNQYETEAIIEMFLCDGFEIVDFEEIADVYVINTCTVTNLSDRKSRQVIRKAKKINPNSIVVVTGCYAQMSKNEILEIKEADIITGTKERAKIIEYVKKALSDKDFSDKALLHSALPDNGYYKSAAFSSVDDSMENLVFENLKIASFNHRNRAYIKIQDGCNQFCSYCIIPFARGSIRSKSLNDIYDEVKNITKNGFKEIILTGIHIASYGNDIGLNLIDVFDKIYNIEGLQRIRLGSLDPVIINEDFVKYISLHKKICPHFHISLQSGCDDVLRRMNRKYTTAFYKKNVDLIKKHIKDYSITTDIIVGFPSETDNEFEQTFNFASSIGFSKIHVFKFSPRKGTLACNMKDQIAPLVKEERSNKLINLSEKMQLEFNRAYEGRIMDILFESEEEELTGYLQGFTSNYIKVIAEIEACYRNTIVTTLLVKAQNGFITGNIER